MSDDKRPAIRVLVADDEAEVRDAYRQIFSDPAQADSAADFRSMRDRLFTAPAAPSKKSALHSSRIVPTFCSGAEAAVAAVQESVAAVQQANAAMRESHAAERFAVVFLDIRMSPGPDGIWAATRIRELDPAVEIVMCTAYSDVDPGELGSLVPPEEKLSYLQKPFHPHEIKQMTVSLASKWRAEHRIATLAHFDALTGLPNREQSREQLGSRIAGTSPPGMLAVLYIDLDDFKRVNDTLGHAVGDELLRVVATRLRHALAGAGQASRSPPDGDHIGRLGGDEFMILRSVSGAEQASILASCLIDALQQPMRLAQHTVVVTPSIGIAMYPGDGATVDTLLRNADLAMYVAKRKGAGLYAFFDAAMNEAALRRFTLEGKLRGALERGEFTLHYQPQFDVTAGSVAGMEALLRWTHPELGAVSPAEFIAVAEETGLIPSIGEWVLRTACTQAKAWLDEGLPLGRMAVNVSGQQFALEDFPATVAKVLATAALDPGMLELEITESVVMQDESWTEVALRELKALGVQLAIDDFGTGYSSFGRLRHFAVDRLKIDQSFMAGLIDSSDNRAIAAAIIAMSRSLRIKVTAEGVESFAQLLFLQEHECQEAQGFLFSRALTATDAHSLLRRAAESASSSRSQRLRVLIG